MKKPHLYTARAIALLLARLPSTPRDLIASELGWTVRQVQHCHEYLTRRGRCSMRLLPRSVRAGRSPLAGREQEIRRMSQDGMSASQIAARFEVSVSCAKNFMEWHGLYAPHRRRGRWGALPVSLRQRARPAVADDADVRAAEQAWREMEEMV